MSYRQYFKNGELITEYDTRTWLERLLEKIHTPVQESEPSPEMRAKVKAFITKIENKEL